MSELPLVARAQIHNDRVAIRTASDLFLYRDILDGSARLASIQLRLKSEQGDVVNEEGMPGEIQVRGNSVFSEYWRRPEVTADSFDDGWFKTGDVAVLENGYYRILGRQSVDIIKSGGYKLSALEIEGVLLDHPSIRECAVVGIPDETWGEVIVAAIVWRGETPFDGKAVRSWSQDRLSEYKIPKRWKAVESLPRNAMGKVTKPAVKKLFVIVDEERTRRCQLRSNDKR